MSDKQSKPLKKKKIAEKAPITSPIEKAAPVIAAPKAGPPQKK